MNCLQLLTLKTLTINEVGIPRIPTENHSFHTNLFPLPSRHFSCEVFAVVNTDVVAMCSTSIRH